MIDISKPLLENAKSRADALRITLSTVVEDALRSHLARTSRPRAGKFHLHTVHGKPVQLGMDLDRTSAFIAHEDEAWYSGRAK
jgi:hypothetical protein